MGQIRILLRETGGRKRGILLERERGKYYEGVGKRRITRGREGKGRGGKKRDIC